MNHLRPLVIAHYLMEKAVVDFGKVYMEITETLKQYRIKSKMQHPVEPGICRAFSLAVIKKTFFC